ncbi:hypothetical protein V1523DRAFT_402869 [Lipomyces doorenjongii]
MISQASDMLSQSDGELLEIPDSPINLRTVSTSIATTTKSRRYSKVWLHTSIVRNDVILNKEGESIWRCKYCSTEYRESGGTTVLANHMQKHHNVNISSAQDAQSTLIQANISDASKNARQAPDYKRRCLSRWGYSGIGPRPCRTTICKMDYNLWYLISHGYNTRV